ncbi:uncharacterized protein [Medicago truncatula]|uniref:uncharacterized protein isoform X2 n=1 Tax=Medicago truncatula TaxID=3880 RepID=UPI000D2F35A3|nr:uncharacterized protein LOC11436696 isoform X2 [Medicago truncatula]
MQPKKLGRGRPKKQKRERLDEESNIVIQPRKMGRTKKQKRKVGRPKKQKTENMDEDGNPSHSESTTNNNNQANQVPEEGSDQVESMSRYLVQVVYPLTMEPELEHKEAENVENSTGGIPENMGELGEAEMSFSHNSNKMAGQIALEEKVPLEKESLSGKIQASNRFEENAPLEKQSLSGEIQASNRFEEVTNMKSISRAGCLSPSFSLKLTEVVDMVRNEDGDEVDSNVRSRPEDTINGYQVKPEFMPMLRKIIGKHGDIAKNCLAKSVKFRSVLLEMICGIISDLDEKNVKNTREEVLKTKIDQVDEIKSMKVEVEWLRTRLVEALDAREIMKKFVMLKEKTDDNRKLIEDVESELKECEEEKKEASERLREICDKETACKQRLAIAKEESATISTTVGYAKSKVKRFLKCSVVDGLF